MAGNEGLTAANIRYLLTVKALDKDGSGVRCVDVAAALGLSKASVHNMMQTFTRLGLVNKVAYGMAVVTERGNAAAQRYSRYYTAVESLLHSSFPGLENLQAAACSLLATVPQQELEQLCVRQQAAAGVN